MTTSPQIETVKTAAEAPAEALLVVFHTGDAPNEALLDGLPRAETFASIGAAQRWPKSRYTSLLLHADGSTRAVLFVAGGPADELEPIIVMRLASAAARTALSARYDHLAFVDSGLLEAEQFAHAVVEGAIRGAYDPAIKKTRKEPALSLGSITLVSDSAPEALQRGAALGSAVGFAKNLARDLGNLPPNDLTPTSFAARAEALSKDLPLTCRTFGPERMQELGMGALLGVAAGSQELPRVIELEYGPQDAPNTLALVGKGLTFDSGGLSLKTAEGMESMKHDMGGAAAVVGGIVAIARLGIPNIRVRAYVGATENMPSGSAMRPGDVLTASNGETIEVVNTDAEGRLVLADLLNYARAQGATRVVDFATLTGGAMISLGSACSLAAGKPAAWVGSVVEAAGKGLERAWQMPIFDEYRRAMDSEIADIKNSGGRKASALTASAFLRDFAGDMEWAHIDIAGTAWTDHGSAHEAVGATGEGVGLIVSLASALSGAV